MMMIADEMQTFWLKIDPRSFVRYMCMQLFECRILQRMLVRIYILFYQTRKFVRCSTPY